MSSKIRRGSRSIIESPRGEQDGRVIPQTRRNRGSRSIIESLRGGRRNRGSRQPLRSIFEPPQGEQDGRIIPQTRRNRGSRQPLRSIFEPLRGGRRNRGSRSIFEPPRGGQDGRVIPQTRGERRSRVRYSGVTENPQMLARRSRTFNPARNDGLFGVSSEMRPLERFVVTPVVTPTPAAQSVVTPTPVAAPNADDDWSIGDLFNSTAPEALTEADTQRLADAQRLTAERKEAEIREEKRRLAEKERDKLISIINANNPNLTDIKADNLEPELQNVLYYIQNDNDSVQSGFPVYGLPFIIDTFFWYLFKNEKYKYAYAILKAHSAGITPNPQNFAVIQDFVNANINEIKSTDESDTGLNNVLRILDKEVTCEPSPKALYNTVLNRLKKYEEIKCIVSKDDVSHTITEVSRTDLCNNKTFKQYDRHIKDNLKTSFTTLTKYKNELENFATEYKKTFYKPSTTDYVETYTYLCNLRNNKFKEDVLNELKLIGKPEEQESLNILTNLYEDTKGAVRVYVRIKPTSSDERKTVVDSTPTNISIEGKINNILDQKTYTNFYGVFDDKFKNVDVYRGKNDPEWNPPTIESQNENEKLKKQLTIANESKEPGRGLHGVFDQLSSGYSISMFGYGLSGSGKTFTILGAKNVHGLIHYGLANLPPEAKIELKYVFEQYVGKIEFANRDPNKDDTMYPLQFRNKIHVLHDRDRDLEAKLFDNYEFVCPKFTSWDQKTTPSKQSRSLSSLFGITNDNAEQFRKTVKDSFLERENVDNEIQYTGLNDIQDLVNNITNHRIKKQRIKRTPNNKESSRSHLYIVFEIKQGDQTGHLTFIDMAGRESPIQLYKNMLDVMDEKDPTNTLVKADVADVGSGGNAYLDGTSAWKVYNTKNPITQMVRYVNSPAIALTPTTAITDTQKGELDNAKKFANTYIKLSKIMKLENLDDDAVIMEKIETIDGWMGKMPALSSELTNIVSGDVKEVKPSDLLTWVNSVAVSFITRLGIRDVINTINTKNNSTANLSNKMNEYGITDKNEDNETYKRFKVFLYEYASCRVAYTRQNIQNILKEGFFINESINHIKYFFLKKNGDKDLKCIDKELMNNTSESKTTDGKNDVCTWKNPNEYKDDKYVMTKDEIELEAELTEATQPSERQENPPSEKKKLTRKINILKNSLTIPILNFLDNLNKNVPSKFVMLCMVRQEENRYEDTKATLEFAKSVKSS